MKKILMSLVYFVTLTLSENIKVWEITHTPDLQVRSFLSHGNMKPLQVIELLEGRVHDDQPFERREGDNVTKLLNKCFKDNTDWNVVRKYIFMNRSLGNGEVISVFEGKVPRGSGTRPFLKTYICFDWVKNGKPVLKKKRLSEELSEEIKRVELSQYVNETPWKITRREVNIEIQRLKAEFEKALARIESR